MLDLFLVFLRVFCGVKIQKSCFFGIEDRFLRTYFIDFKILNLWKKVLKIIYLKFLEKNKNG